MLPDEHGAKVFWMEPDLLHGVPDAERGAAAHRLVQRRYREQNSLVRLEPIFDSEKEIKGYMVYTKP